MAIKTVSHIQIYKPNSLPTIQPISNSSTAHLHLRAFKYKRKSQDGEDRQALSFTNQERVIVAIPSYPSFTIVGDVEEAKSAKTPEQRKLFNQMIKMIERGEIDVILCWKIHRLARNPVDGGKIIWAVQNGLKIVTPYKTYEGLEVIQELYNEFSYAHKFTNDISTNTQEGTMTKIAQGKAPIKAPIGYRNTPEKKQGTREILPDEKNWDLARKTWDLLLSGKYRIAKIYKIAVGEWGLTHWNGKPISRSQVYRMFTTTFYYGEYFYKGEMRWGIHKPMITQDEYDLAQRILGSRGRPRFINREFAYSEWMKCTCGSSITADERFRRWCYTCKKKFNAETYEICPQCKNEFSDNLIHLVSYHCSKKKNSQCKQPSISLTNLEKQIDNILGTFEIPEDYSKWALEMLRKESEQENNDRVTIENSLMRKVQDISKRLSNLQYRFLSPDNENGEMISEAEYKDLKSKMIKERTEAETELRKTNYQQQHWLEVAEKAFKFAVNARYWFRYGTKEQKRAIFQAIGSDPVLEGGILRVNLLNAFATIQKMALLGKEENGWFVPQNQLQNTAKTPNFPAQYP